MAVASPKTKEVDPAIESGVIVGSKKLSGTKKDGPDSVKEVKKMREEESNRYTEEIDKALDKLLKKPKSEWPELLRK